ncbi:MAG: hypothetical protein Q4P24_13925, partial [Rhodobacterales bacterium]|nr:hypothetical protein [Rhodobacterales bacterium]
MKDRKNINRSIGWCSDRCRSLPAEWAHGLRARKPEMHPVEKAVRDLEAPISPVAADEGLDIAGTQLIKTAIQKQAAASAV